MTDLCYTPIKCPSFFSVAGDCETVNHDIRINEGCLDEGDPVVSAVIIQLLTDRRADGQGGFWGDEFIGFPIGSRLHTLSGRPTSQNLNALTDEMIREALEPLIDQGCFDEVSVRVVDTVEGPEALVDILKDGKSLFSLSL